MVLVLELFKGTGSAGKNAKKRGYDVISLDCEKKFDPDIVSDILKWNFKKEPLLKRRKVDFIWASPPCNTFSWLSQSTHQRDAKTLKPLTEKAIIGNKVLFRTIKIIKYFYSLNDNLFYVIENPQALMRKMRIMKPIPVSTTLYCLYGSKLRKPTDFFNNYPFDLKLKQSRKCTGETIGVVDVPKIERFRVPQRLITSIFKQFEVQKTNGTTEIFFK